MVENVEYFQQFAGKERIMMVRGVIGHDRDCHSTGSRCGGRWSTSKAGSKGRVAIWYSSVLGLGERSELRWNEEYAECMITSGGAYYFYPCLNFVRERLRVIAEGGMGAFVWEAGQGMKQFYEVL